GAATEAERASASKANPFVGTLWSESIVQPLDPTRCAVQPDESMPKAAVLFIAHNLPTQHWNCQILRDTFGNPFRPVTISPTWQTPPVTSLAPAAYEERSMPSGELEPARLAILADALEEAGCQEQLVLDHLRSPGP